MSKKIKLKKINFNKKLIESVNLFGQMFKETGLDFQDLPEKMDVIVDLDKVVGCSEVIKLESSKVELEPAFKIYFSGNKDDSWDISGECYDDFIAAYCPDEPQALNS